MRNKIEFANVEGLGLVAAQIHYRVDLMGEEYDRKLGAVTYKGGTPLEDQHRPAVAAKFDAEL